MRVSCRRRQGVWLRDRPDGLESIDTELRKYRSRLGLGIECDLHFEADKPVSAYIEEPSRLGRINA